MPPNWPPPPARPPRCSPAPLLAPGTPIVVVSHGLDKYGRTLATIGMPTAWSAPDGRTTTDFGTAMLWSGNAVPYAG
jgi:hypothetical protein